MSSARSISSDARERILDAASDLFYRQGYNATGINEVIAVAGVAKATLYNHFSSKDELCLAYLQQRHAVFQRDLHEFLASYQEGTDRVVGLFDFVQEFYETEDFGGCWCIKMIAEIPAQDVVLRAEIQRQKHALLQLIQSELEKQTSPLAESSDTLARKMYLLYESAVSESHLHQADWPIHMAKEMSIKLLL